MHPVKNGGITQAPVQGVYTLDSPLITAENAAEYYFPDSPY
ncbi:hypothetical protein [Gemmobacter caeruleus]|nr:hypothetical protein [Gemmobacter caeruleus]